MWVCASPVKVGWEDVAVIVALTPPVAAEAVVIAFVPAGVNEWLCLLSVIPWLWDGMDTAPFVAVADIPVVSEDVDSFRAA